MINIREGKEPTIGDLWKISFLNFVDVFHQRIFIPCHVLRDEQQKTTEGRKAAEYAGTTSLQPTADFCCHKFVYYVELPNSWLLKSVFPTIPAERKLLSLGLKKTQILKFLVFIIKTRMSGELESSDLNFVSNMKINEVNQVWHRLFYVSCIRWVRVVSGMVWFYIAHFCDSYFDFENAM